MGVGGHVGVGQMELGAVGVSCQKVSEAEVMVRLGNIPVSSRSTNQEPLDGRGVLSRWLLMGGW